MSSDRGDVAELSFALPQSLDTRIHIRLVYQIKALSLFLTTTSHDDTATLKSMGSFVYALPDRFNPQQPLSTTLFSHEPTIEFTTRVAKILAKRHGIPIYVTNSMSLDHSGIGGTVEEEMEALKGVIDVTSTALSDIKKRSDMSNGDP